MKKKTLRMTLVGVCAALLAVLAQVQIPLPSGIPVTLQTFAARDGTLAVLLYLSLGAAGLPVFSGFSGGIASFFGPAGGYLWGFLPMAALCGAKANGSRAVSLALGVCGLAACHALGAVQYGLLSGAGAAAASLTASVPYLAKDVLSVVLAGAASGAVRAALGKSGLSPRA